MDAPIASRPDLAPIQAHLASRYDGDPKQLVDALYEVGAYLIREPRPEDRADTLRRMVGIVHNLAAAFDETQPLADSE